MKTNIRTQYGLCSSNKCNVTQLYKNFEIVFYYYYLEGGINCLTKLLTHLLFKNRQISLILTGKTKQKNNKKEHTLPWKNLGLVRFLMFLKEVSYACQGWIYLIKNTTTTNSNIVKYHNLK